MAYNYYKIISLIVNNLINTDFDSISQEGTVSLNTPKMQKITNIAHGSRISLNIMNILQSS